MFLVLLFAPLTFAKITIASYDTQFQFSHSQLIGKMWTNTEEILDGLDNDSNGYPDDVNGWNFGDDNNIMYEEESSLYDANTALYAELKMKQRAKLITEPELKWLTDNAPTYESKWRDYIGFIHGTASATNILKDTQDVLVMGLRVFSKSELIPSTTSQPQEPSPTTDEATEAQISSFKNTFIKEVYKTFYDGVVYAADKEVRGFQFGVLWQLAAHTPGSLKAKMARELGLAISDERSVKLAREFYEGLLEEGKDLFSSRPDILFVMPSGNSGIDSDTTLAFPNDLPGENTIVVGASDFFNQRAIFSSYGKESVDILIPTINIVEAVPNNLNLVSSATSVSVVIAMNVVARVMEINPNLSTQEVKKCIYDTADKHTYLDAVVKTGSIINKERAVEAARMSRFMDLETAIQKSFTVVPHGGH